MCAEEIRLIPTVQPKLTSVYPYLSWFLDTLTCAEEIKATLEDDFINQPNTTV